VKPPFDRIERKARIAVLLHDPRAPTDKPRQHQVRLLPIDSDDQLQARWQAPQAWCRQNVQHQRGHRWSRRMDRESGQPVFSFSDAATGMMFALRFR
jgi:hypothetical protein